jgi:hypothetical protein
LPQIRALGGDSFGISAEKQEYVVQTKEKWELNYGLVCDLKNRLAKKFGVTVTKKESNKTKATIGHFEQNGIPTDMIKEEAAYPEGMSQSSVIVLSSTGEIVYQWHTRPLMRNWMGAKGRMPPADIFEVINYYFSADDRLTSVITYIRVDPRATFDNMRKDNKIKEVFVNHLKKEFSYENLEFVEEVEKVTEQGQISQEDEKRIYDEYIVDASAKEVNLPAKIKKLLKGYIVDGVERTNVKKHVFETAVSSMTITMMTDSFERFVKTEEFVKIFVEKYPSLLKKQEVQEVETPNVQVAPVVEQSANTAPQSSKEQCCTMQ